VIWFILFLLFIYDAIQNKIIELLIYSLPGIYFLIIDYSLDIHSLVYSVENKYKSGSGSVLCCDWLFHIIRAARAVTGLIGFNRFNQGCRGSSWSPVVGIWPDIWSRFKIQVQLTCIYSLYTFVRPNISITHTFLYLFLSITITDFRNRNQNRNRNLKRMNYTQ